MTRWLTIHRDDVPILFFTVGSLGLATIVGMNIVLFYRILVGDYLGSKKNKDECDDEDSNVISSEPECKSSSVTRRQPHQIVRSLFDKDDD